MEETGFGTEKKHLRQTFDFELKFSLVCWGSFSIKRFGSSRPSNRRKVPLNFQKILLRAGLKIVTVVESS